MTVVVVTIFSRQKGACDQLLLREKNVIVAVTLLRFFVRMDSYLKKVVETYQLCDLIFVESRNNLTE